MTQTEADLVEQLQVLLQNQLYQSAIILVCLNPIFHFVFHFQRAKEKTNKRQQTKKRVRSFLKNLVLVLPASGVSGSELFKGSALL